MRKASFLSLFAISFVLLLAGQAAATICSNASKKPGAGNIGDVIIHLDGTVTEPTNPGGQIAGGFVDLFVEVEVGGEIILIKLASDLFILDIKHAMAAGLPLPELPHGAHLAAGCGVAVDDVIICGP